MMTAEREAATSARHRVCTKCVMDTTTPSITFDPSGVCCFCRAFEQQGELEQRDSVSRADRWRHAIEWIRARGRGRKFDCIVGVSGGVDSTYLALVLRDAGLRQLLVQFDNGWNSEVAAGNIRRLVSDIDAQLVTRVVDWEEFRDLQLSFLRASVVDLEAPTDHGIIGTLYEAALREHVPTVLTGANRETEGICVPDYGYNRMDPWFLRDIHRRYGHVPLRTFPVVGPWRHLRLQFLRDVRFLPLLDYLAEPYHKQTALQALRSRLNWRDYGGKHHESLFTKFHQVYYLPTKAGIDKRRAHLSSLVHSGQLTREEALSELSGPAAAPDELARLVAYVKKKLQLSDTEFQEIMGRPIQGRQDFRNGERFFTNVQAVKARLRRQLGRESRTRPF
jgi:N-acetyl sugar amidotransferase